MDSYSYTGVDSGALAGFFAIYAIVVLAVAAFMIVCMWKIFSKAGQPGWASIIPFYNSYVLFDIAWGNGLLFLLMLVPAANTIIAIILYVKLSQAFGYSGAFAVGLIFLPIIFIPVLAFGNNTYIGPQ